MPFMWFAQQFIHVMHSCTKLCKRFGNAFNTSINSFMHTSILYVLISFIHQSINWWYNGFIRSSAHIWAHSLLPSNKSILQSVVGKFICSFTITVMYRCMHKCVYMCIESLIHWYIHMCVHVYIDVFSHDKIHSHIPLRHVRIESFCWFHNSAIY